ncbi:MAG: SRPBCC family protein [Candidatus Geothermincolia bacterium]
MIQMIRELTVRINATPEQVYAFLSDYAGHFKEVSPDHIERGVEIKSIRMKDGRFEGGRIYFYFKQVSPVTGRVQKVRGKLLKVEENKYVKYRFLFPVSLVLPVIENTLQSEDGNTIYRTFLHFSAPVSWLADHSRKVADKLEAVSCHIQEEMDNTRDILEGKKSSP